MTIPTNLFDDLPSHLPDELVTSLLEAASVRIERIVSHSHASPEGFWYDQDQHEWAPAAAIERIRADLEAERSTESFAKKKQADSRRREKAQAEYVEDFLGAVVTFLAFHPVSSALAWGHFLGVARATARKPDRGPRQKIIEKKRKAHLNGPP